MFMDYDKLLIIATIKINRNDEFVIDAFGSIV